MTTLAKLKTENLNNLSDWRMYSLLIQGYEFDELGLYKACVAVSVHGTILPQSSKLNPLFQKLLEVRYSNHLGQLDQSLEQLGEIESAVAADSLYAAEVWFLRGVISNRISKNDVAKEVFLKAHRIYVESGESHRALRSLINAKICERDLENSIHGELLALEREARRQGFFDLVGNITKARAIELGNRGNFFAAFLEADVAVKSYKLDGFPEDHDLALCLVAIFGHLCGETTKGAWAFREIQSRGGKLQVYIEAYQNLISGRRPVLPENHPLTGIDWKIQHKKVDSITGKIIARLRQSPATRDEIIENVWGVEATDPSYCSRFYSALTQIRRRQNVAILFDGTRYALA